MMNIAGYSRAIMGIPRYWHRSRDVHYVRLAMRREILPRFVPGSYVFPFGRIDYADAASFEAQYFAIFVEREYAFVPTSPTPVILDCGGNIGLSALWFKREYPGAKITVFEPGPDLFPILKANLSRHGCTDVNTEQVAVWDKETTLKLNNDAADGGFVSTHTESVGRTVPAIKLADRINGPVDLLKIDIEGAEFVVFKDLVDTGKIKHIRSITGELHAGSNDIDKVAELFQSLHDNGFRTTISYARPVAQLMGKCEATPFPSLCDGRYIALFYAWKEQ